MYLSAYETMCLSLTLSPTGTYSLRLRRLVL